VEIAGSKIKLELIVEDEGKLCKKITEIFEL
jgi:hypothetical protein